MERMTETEWRAFLLEGPRTGKLATVRPDGRPHVAPIWFDLDDRGDTVELVFTTFASSVKGRNLANDPRVSLCVDDDRPPYSFVVVEGEARMSTDPADLVAWPRRIAERYLGTDKAVERDPVEGEQVVHVHIHHVVADRNVAD
jgi:PPOX class probable F420-dependent enzyme